MLIFGFIARNLSDNFYNINLISIDENVDKIKEIIESNSNYKEIESSLKKYNYSLTVYEDKQLVYGANNETLEKIMKQSNIPNNETKTIFIDNSTGVIKIKDETIMIAQRNVEREAFFGNDRNSFQMFLIRFIIFSSLSIIVVVFVAMILSKKVVKRVMKPAEQLADGANRIRKGNYNENIEYKNNDEFSIVVDNFNEMQKALKQEKEKNKKYEIARQDMINGISHDVRTPLTAIKGHIKGIQDGVANTEEKRNQYLSIAYNRAIDIENLLNRLFDTFNYESGEIKLYKTKVEVGKFIEKYIENKKEELKAKNVEMVYIKSCSDEYIKIDEIQFVRVFDNLLNNSIKYANQDKLRININIWKEDNNIKIGFKDNGNGVKEENLKYLFNEFYKEDNSRTNSKENGSGLGLFIVKTIIDAHNGTINVENRDGLYFEITLRGEIDG